jgi:hypothetical protein
MVRPGLEQVGALSCDRVQTQCERGVGNDSLILPP